MKIYLADKQYLSILNKINQLSSYLLESKILKEIYSDEGIYNLDDMNIFKLNIVNEETNVKTLNNLDLIIEKTKIDKEKVTQLPINHIYIKNKIEIYKVNKRSLLSLHIIYYNSPVYSFESKGFTDNFIAYDYFFYISDNYDYTITDNLLIENINEFLSLLK